MNHLKIYFLTMSAVLLVAAGCGEYEHVEVDEGEGEGASGESLVNGSDNADRDDKSNSSESSEAADGGDSSELCAGLSCGDPCSECPPEDDDCAEPTATKYCTADGECQSEEPKCEDDDYDPCEGLACGDLCSLCPPDDEDCVETAALKRCNADGECGADFEDNCPVNPDPYEPCEGLSCGDTCSECPPDDEECVETTAVKYCTADGECQLEEPKCEGEEYDPCGGLACGDICSLCPPDDDDCVETAALKRCNVDGECGADFGPGCPGESDPYDPCEGLSCGDSCSVCPSDDDDCYETAVLKYCDADGECVMSEPSCAAEDL